jgi:Stage II sporulation protein E (SpoIIE)
MVWHVWGRLAGSVQRLRRRLGDVGATAVLIALAGVLALGALAGPDLMRPGAVLAVPVLLGGLSLPLREFRLLVLGCVLLGTLVAVARGLWVLSVGSVLIFVVVVAVSYEQTRRRQRLGVRRARPDQILLDLRERLRVQGEVPPLPAGWGMEVELRPADDAGLAGDFVVSRMHAVEAVDGRHDLLDLALVDVSGKGVDAGTRALLLSGALGGLLGAVPPEHFLAEANRYLLQQRWAEGFATAVYLRVDLTTGEFRVESAGHPPVAHLDAGSGTWRLLLRRGPLLGVLPEVGQQPDTGLLRRGDAVLLYSDGVVEDRHRDLEVGVDRLLGAAERLVPRGDYRGGAASLVREVPTNRGDDRAIVMLWREY